MASLKDIVSYICYNYPHKDDLSKARLTKLVYLSDWKMSIDQGRQISPTKWYFNHFGPYVYDIEELARCDGDFDLEQTSNSFGSLKEIIRFKGHFHAFLLPAERAAIDFAIEKTRSLGWDAFIKLIYSTYPIVTESRYEYLDLPALAREYKSWAQVEGMPPPSMG
jgi:hypothetical protein